MEGRIEKGVGSGVGWCFVLESCCDGWVGQSALFDGVPGPSCCLYTGSDSSGCC